MGKKRSTNGECVCRTAAPDRQRSGAARCYTTLVPTTRPRHTITETPPVHEALEELRAKLNGSPIDMAELVILGAHAKARRLQVDNVAARAARKRLADMIRTGSFPYEIDLEAAKEVKHLGLIANYDE
jgi:hypothetical protein